MLIKNSRSKKLLDKVYDRLEKIDIDALSMSELKDFLGVVQQGQFLETTGAFGGYQVGCGFGGANPGMFNSTENSTEPGEIEEGLGK